MCCSASGTPVNVAGDPFSKIASLSSLPVSHLPTNLGSKTTSLLVKSGNNVARQPLKPIMSTIAIAAIKTRFMFLYFDGVKTKRSFMPIETNPANNSFLPVNSKKNVIIQNGRLSSSDECRHKMVVCLYVYTDRTTLLLPFQTAP